MNECIPWHRHIPSRVEAKTRTVKLACLTFCILFGCAAFVPARGSAPGMDTAVSCASVSQIPQRECEALGTLYYSLDGKRWSYSDGWLQSNQPCSWVGVLCHGGHVTGLSLAFNNLNGVLPGAVGDLPHLTTLNLIHNQIRGLPPELAELTSLQSLFLSNNNLTSLPPEIGELSNLRELHLSGNPLALLPPEVGALSELRELYLLIDSLWELPPELAVLQNLRVLRVSSPLLSETLPDMGLWRQLEVLELSGCRLNVWPAGLDALPALHTLDLSHNELVVLPAAVGYLTKLRVLDLSDNSLADIPAEIGHLHLLTALDLSQNELGVLPDEIGALTSLESLDLSANRLAGVPAALGNLASIQNELNVAHNRLSALPARVSEGELVRAGWQDTQTVPPTELRAEIVTERVTEIEAGSAAESGAEKQVRLTWRPITYTDGGGYYEILHSAAAVDGEHDVASPDADERAVEYQVVGQTTSKETDTYILEGLDPTQVHEWVLRTYTPAHDIQKNYLWSEPSARIQLYFPHVTLNHRQGQPGTLFAATAEGFPPSTAVNVYANGLLLDTLTTDSDGTLHFVLNTTDADPGEYEIEVAVDVRSLFARAASPLTLSHESARHAPPAATAPIVFVPNGLTKMQSDERQIYLPTIVR